MNADLDEAMGLLAPPEARTAGAARTRSDPRSPRPRTTGAGACAWPSGSAGSSTRTRFGVQALYVFGSTKNATAGPASDIDLLVHFEGDDRQRECLTALARRLEPCLAEMNYLRTGYQTRRACSTSTT